jgi:acetyl esterase
VYKPEGENEKLPFIFSVHGGGWMFGTAVDFEAFVFDLIKRTRVAIVFPEYTLAPEKKHPTQIEQCIDVLQDLLQNGDAFGLKVDKVVMEADSAGCMLLCID